MSLMADTLRRLRTQPDGSNRIRPLQEADIPQIAALHDRVMGRRPDQPAASTRQHFMRIFLQHPWCDPALPSLVCEAADGNIIGCIGVMPRRLRFGDRIITMVVTHNFMVAPDMRSSLAGLQLAQQVLAGPQDLSLAEGNNTSRRVWESFNGSVSLLYSLHWTRPLQPCRYLLSFLQKRGLPSLLAPLLWPLCRLADSMLPRLLEKKLTSSPPACSGEELDAATLCFCQQEFCKDRQLRPLPDATTLAWQLQALDSRTGMRLHKVLVRGGSGEVLGCYLYYAGGPQVAGSVVQLIARNDKCREIVLAHLFHHARQQGVYALSGQFDPALFQSLARQHCAFHHDGNSWFLMHSRRPEILQAINAGQTFLSRMEGEWWVNFING